MELKILGDEHLTQVSTPVENFNELKEIVPQMFDLMHKTNGIGLAAPQVGLNVRFFIVDIEDGNEWVFVNPQIIETSQDLCDYEEGCLSIPKFYANVQRPKQIIVQYFDINGKPHTIQADGLLARVIQHENDHLNGVLFIDYLSEEKKLLAEKIVKKHAKKYVKA